MAPQARLDVAECAAAPLRRHRAGERRVDIAGHNDEVRLELAKDPLQAAQSTFGRRVLELNVRTRQR